MFSRNVGGIDRVWRVTLGTVLFLAGLLLLSEKSSLGVTVAVVGVIAMVTGIVRFCVLYIPFGISTARLKEQRMDQMCCGMSMNEIQGKGSADKPSAAPEKEVGEVMTAGQKR
jgi:hypothetical protein